MTNRYMIKDGQKRYLVATYMTRAGANSGYRAMSSSGMISKDAFIKKLEPWQAKIEGAVYGLYA